MLSLLTMLRQEDPPKIVEVEDYLDVDFVELEARESPAWKC